jgi:hypothetical protein
VVGVVLLSGGLVRLLCRLARIHHPSVAQLVNHHCALPVSTAARDQFRSTLAISEGAAARNEGRPAAAALDLSYT